MFHSFGTTQSSTFVPVLTFKKFTSEIYLKGYLICYVEAMNLPLEQIIEEYIHLYNNHREAEKG